MLGINLLAYFKIKKEIHKIMLTKVYLTSLLQSLTMTLSRSLVGCSPWGREESDTTERLHFHFSLLCIEEGNGNPRQCSCLENPRDGGAWWVAVYGVSQSRTQLKRLSSSSSSSSSNIWHYSRGVQFMTLIQFWRTRGPPPLYPYMGSFFL